MNPVRTRAILSVASLLCASVAAHAGGLVPRPGIELSGSFVKVSRTDEASGDDIFDTRFGAGWSAAVTAEWAVSSRVAVVSGLRYSSTAETETVGISSSSGSIGGELRETWHWITVPLHARITPWSVPLSFDIGPEMAVLLQAKSKLEVDRYSFLRRTRGDVRAAATADIFEDVGTFGQEDVTDLYHRVDYVLGGGMRYTWPMRSGRLVAQARYGFGLTDLMKSRGVERRTQSYQAGLGWQW